MWVEFRLDALCFVSAQIRGGGRDMVYLVTFRLVTCSMPRENPLTRLHCYRFLV